VAPAAAARDAGRPPRPRLARRQREGPQSEARAASRRAAEVPRRGPWGLGPCRSAPLRPPPRHAGPWSAEGGRGSSRGCPADCTDSRGLRRTHHYSTHRISSFPIRWSSLEIVALLKAQELGTMRACRFLRSACAARGPRSASFERWGRLASRLPLGSPSELRCPSASGVQRVQCAGSVVGSLPFRGARQTGARGSRLPRHGRAAGRGALRAVRRVAVQPRRAALRGRRGVGLHRPAGAGSVGAGRAVCARRRGPELPERRGRGCPGQPETLQKFGKTKGRLSGVVRTSQASLKACSLFLGGRAERFSQSYVFWVSNSFARLRHARV
jgi:hypothetical protein